jgi:hypothetical protein
MALPSSNANSLFTLNFPQDCIELSQIKGARHEGCRSREDVGPERRKHQKVLSAVADGSLRPKRRPRARYTSSVISEANRFDEELNFAVHVN